MVFVVSELFRVLIMLRRTLALVTLVLAVGSVHAAKAPVDRPALSSAKAYKSLLVDIATAGPRLVAVGERGHVLFSDDQGRNWEQSAKVPVSNMLTAVSFPTDKVGYAVGHEGVVLRTQDSGKTWALVRADRENTYNHAPLLDAWFRDENTGFAVGAYGYFLMTTDGGQTWQDQASKIVNPDGLHLNSVQGVPGQPDTIFIAGEQGLLFRSTDGGQTWAGLPSPFQGSFLGVSALAPDLVLVYGLQGKIFITRDLGASWESVESGTTSVLNNAALLADGRLVVVGNGGVVLTSFNRGRSFIKQSQSDRQSIVAVTPLANGRMVTVGEGGVKIISGTGK